MIKKLLIFLSFFAFTPLVNAQDATANFSSVHQVIDGFGVNDAFLGAFSDAVADQLFDRTAGIGLNILRVGIDSSGGTMGAYSNITKAAARGAIIIAVPWTAAAGQKDNGSETNGGHLLVGSYNAWATTLAGFQAVVSSNTGGVKLYGISPQEEPDFTATYVSMLYTTAEMTAFIKVLGPKLAALTPVPILMMPDLANWSNTWSYTSDTLADGVAAPYVGIVVAHQYAGTSAPSGIGSLKVWQTEMSYFNAYDNTISNALTWAADIHTAFNTGNASAIIWWWAIRSGPTDNESLITATETPKRYYTFGNYSKYILPGWLRVDVTGGPPGVAIDAFKSANGSKITVVATNTSGSSVSLGVNVSGLSVSSVIPHVTSSTQNLADLSPINLSAGKFTATIANNTVTTFTGDVVQTTGILLQ